MELNMFGGVVIMMIVSPVIGLGLKGSDSGCGNPRDIMKPSEGTLVSHPGYGQTLAPLSFCEWILAPPAEKFVSLTIEDMGNISCITQLFVYTHLGGERYPGWNLCGEGTFPLHGVPHHLASRRGTWLRILYRGNKISDQTTGFSAKYSFQEPGCSGSQRLTGSPFWFASHPGVGMWAMEAGSVCSWTLTAPYGHYVALKRGPVDLHCVSGWQTLAVHDGQDITNSSLIVTLTCTTETSPVASSGRHLQLLYMDRWASNSLGFNISYAFYKTRQSGCGGNAVLTAPSGYLLSHQPSGGSTYSLLSRCKWRILSPPGTRINFQFELFDLAHHHKDGGCNRDLLVLHDGLAGSAASHVFCNPRSGPPSALISRNHVIDVYFSTESLRRNSKQGAGFIVRYARMCSEPDSIPNASWISPDENQDGVYKITVGETVHYACAQGFVLEPSQSIRTCTDNGVLSGEAPICRARICERIPHPPFSQLEIRDINMDGIIKVTYREILQYKCLTGYSAIAGDSRRHCMANGTVSGEDLKCEAARCPAHPTVLHTTVVILDTQRDGPEVVSFGEKVIYTCNHGYMEASGSSMRECLADGSYSGKNLVCTARVCGEMPNVPYAKNESVDLNNDGDLLSFPEQVRYTCETGYEPKGGDTARTCTADGKLNGTDLICKNSLGTFPPKFGRFYPMSKPAALGTAIALCFFIVTMIVLISLIVVKIRRRKAAERRRKHARKISLQEKMPPHHAFTLPRTVTTPWDTAPCMGRRRDEVLMSRGPFYFRWPMYLEDFTTDKIKMGMDI